MNHAMAPTFFLADLPPFPADSPGCVTVVIETAKGSRSKLAYDAMTGGMRLRHILPEGMRFPFNFGFVPGTLAGDGDPLDVLVFLEDPLPSGTILEARLIGVIEARQRKHEGEFEENNRLLAVPDVARSTVSTRGIDDLRPGLLDEVEAFLTQYNLLRGIAFEPLRRAGPARAVAMVHESLPASQHGDAQSLRGQG